MDPNPPAPDISDIASALGNLTLHPSDISHTNTAAITLLASASRTNPSARESLADPKVLDILIQTIESSINDSLETVEVALRCLGNACIDNDDAKTELTRRGFGWANLCLPPVENDGNGDSLSNINDPAVGILTMKVLYNICSDNSAAQKRCFDEKIHYALTLLFGRQSSPSPTPQETALFVELLFGICSHINPEQDNTPPSSVLKSLLNLPDLYKDSLDTEDFALLIETCLLFLREPAVKTDVIEQRLLRSVWTMLAINERNIARLRIDDNDGRRVLIPLSTGVIWILSDLAAIPTFAAQYFRDDDFIRNVVVATIAVATESSSNATTPRLVDAACQVLGNLLWSTQEPHRYEGIASLHTSLTKILTESQDAELLHSAAGLLIQLCRLFAELREILGREANTQVVVGKLCQHDMPQLKQDGIALLRVLGKDSPANQERFADLAKDAMSAIPLNDTAMVET